VDGVQPHIPENPAPGGGVLAPPAAAAGAERSADEPVLTRELQLYLDKVVDVLTSCESAESEQDARGFAGGCSGVLSAGRADGCGPVLSALSSDAGLERLTPNLVRLVAERVTANLRNLPALWTSVRLAAALVRNSHLSNLDL
jgi:hypothetical protein